MEIDEDGLTLKKAREYAEKVLAKSRKTLEHGEKLTDEKVKFVMENTDTLRLMSLALTEVKNQLSILRAKLDDKQFTIVYGGALDGFLNPIEKKDRYEFLVGLNLIDEVGL